MGLMNNINEPTRQIHSEIVRVGKLAVQLPNHVEASWVQFMHEHDTATVYYGGSNISLENGFGALANTDTSERYPVHNTDKFWVISDTDDVLLKILWGE